MSRLANTPTAVRLRKKATGEDKIGQRGKDTEKEVKKVLTSLSNRYAAFGFERNPDARTAGGHIGRQTGDYRFFAPKLHGVIEVKALKHDFRLPRDRFIKKTPTGLTNNSLERLHNRALCGGLIVVLVHHTTTDLWRVVPLKFLRDGENQPSWDLSPFRTYATPAEALEGLERAVINAL